MFNVLVSWLPPVVWAALIFALSHTPDLGTGLEYDFLLRKIAHVTEYFILTLLLYRALRRTTALASAPVLAWSAAGALLYAISDEIHQLFIPGRQGAPADVLIDSLGILLAAALVAGVRRRRP